MPHNRYRLHAMTALFLFGIATAIPGAAAEEAAQPSPDAGTATAGSENSQLRNEVEQLKQLVLQQQARITALERQQMPGAPPPHDDQTDMLSSFGTPAPI